MPSPDLSALRQVLSDLSLRESDFSAGDTVVAKVASFATETDALDTSSEPWLAEWLAAEHYKAGVLYAAGKVNWNHEQQGQGTAADARMRATIVQRFNAWAAQVQDRLSSYEEKPSAETVRPWLAELARFKSDPVRNV